MARRVLPIPPAPVKVTSLALSTSAAASQTSSSRPISGVSGAGRLFAGEMDLASMGLVARDGAPADRVARLRSSSRSDRKSAVVSASGKVKVFAPEQLSELPIGRHCGDRVTGDGGRSN